MSAVWSIHKNQNSVYMIGHDYCSIEFHMGMVLRNLFPTSGGEFTQFIEMNLIVNELAKQGKAIAGTDGDKICAFLRVIVAFQTWGSAFVVQMPDDEQCVGRNMTPSCPS